MRGAVRHSVQTHMRSRNLRHVSSTVRLRCLIRFT